MKANLGDAVDVSNFSFTASGLDAVAAHPRWLRNLGATYVLLAPGGQMGAPLGPDLELVHRDRAADIYRVLSVEKRPYPQ